MPSVNLSSEYILLGNLNSTNDVKIYSLDILCSLSFFRQPLVHLPTATMHSCHVWESQTEEQPDALGFHCSGMTITSPPLSFSTVLVTAVIIYFFLWEQRLQGAGKSAGFSATTLAPKQCFVGLGRGLSGCLQHQCVNQSSHLLCARGAETGSPGQAG